MYVQPQTVPQIFFEALVRDAAKGAFVVITESRCWVAALASVKPGDYFNADGSRSACACDSVQAGCAWQRDGRQTGGKCWFGGRKGRNLINPGKLIDIREDEDDQAVLADLWVHKPDMFVLDYNRNLFWVLASMVRYERGCP